MWTPADDVLNLAAGLAVAGRARKTRSMLSPPQWHIFLTYHMNMWCISDIWTGALIEAHLRARNRFKNQREEKFIFNVCTKTIIFIGPVIKHQWIQETEASLWILPLKNRMCSILVTMPDLNCIVKFADFTEVLEEQCPVVQESWDAEAEGKQGHWKDITHHMSDKLRSFTKKSFICSLHEDLLHW